MIEVHLIGYTEDGEQLVFDLDPEGEGCYAVSVDPDLLATLAAASAASAASSVAGPNGMQAGSDEADGAPASSTLRPAEIQHRLRAGRSVQAVAEEAGVEPARIERWLPPILAERDRVLRDAWERNVGEGDTPLREQVEAALDARGAPPQRRVWSAARRADGRWRVSVRFPEDGRSRSATWTMRAEGGPLSPASRLASELYPVRRRRR